MIAQLFAGIGLGLLVGLLLGLSASPVVSLVVGALATGMVTLLGFASSSKVGEAVSAGSPRASTIRLGSFGVACTAMVLLGLFIRTHDWASPSITAQVRNIQQAGYTPEEARRWVAYRNLGTSVDSNSEKSRAEGQRPAVASSVLFSSGNSGECQYFDTSRFKNTKEHLDALHQMGGTYAEYADKIGTLDPNQQEQVLRSLGLLFCPQ